MNKRISEFQRKNQVEVFASKIRPEETFEDYIHLLPSISSERQERIKLFRFNRDKLRCLKAELTLRKVMTKEYGIPSENIKFKTSKYGKPFLDNIEIHFNLSHSGDWIVCAISNIEVGIDIEKIQPVDYSIADKYFSQKEFEVLNKLPESERLSYFFEIWTLKESFIKAVGKGLAIPLDSFSVTKTNNAISFYSKDYKYYHFKQYEIDSNYKISVCSANRKFSENIMFL